MLIAYEAPSNARVRSVVVSIEAGAPNVWAIRRATTSEVLRRSSLISNKQILELPSSGNERISPSKFFANTVLPAPINVIFLDEWLIGFLWGRLSRRSVPALLF